MKLPSRFCCQHRTAAVRPQRHAAARAIVVLALLLSLADARAAAQSAPGWSYAGPAGPERWALLAPEWATCGAGHRQSPVNIAAGAPASASPLSITYAPASGTLRHTGHTIQADLVDGGSLLVDDTPYRLVQMHFHTPGEHSVDGRVADAELHLVHRSEAGRLAVIGIRLFSGTTNPAYERLVSRLPAKGESPHGMGGLLDVAALLPSRSAHWRYDGSLTTPPCTEGVTWIVMSTPVTLGAEQLARLTALIPATNRPLQSMGERQFLP